MATFNFQPISRFASGQTSIKRPKHILEFSFDDEHKLHLSDQSLRYYYPPFFEGPWPGTPEMSLSKGYDDWIKADDSLDLHLDGLLQTIQAHEEQLLQDGTPVDQVRLQADIVAWRGIMTKVCCSSGEESGRADDARSWQGPYDDRSDFELNLTCFQGTIYLELNHSYMQASNEESLVQQRKRGRIPPELMQYWGYKFETLSTLPKPWGECTREEIEGRTEEIVNNNAQYCSIVRTGIGTTSLILAGEVDCVMNQKPESPYAQIPWVELKTSVDEPIDSPRSARKWEMKLLKFWAQSFLVGVPTIVVGLRTNSSDGRLTTLRTLETQKLPAQVKKMENSWNGHVCINATAAFLEFVKAQMMGKDGVWRLKVKGYGMNLYQIEDSGTGRILEPGFKAHREKLLAAEIAHKLGGSAST